MSNILLTSEEVQKRGWKSVDIVLITGDAYVDHPSFGIAIIAHVLEAAGFRIAILSQPDWRTIDDFRKFGRPNLFFGITAGNMDSMVNKYTSLRKVRNNDAYSEGGTPFRRPDRATIVYSQRAREAYSDVPVILGGVEASLRRFAHYDYWSDSVRRSILLDSKANLLVYGMAELQIVEIAKRLDSGEPINHIRDVRGTVFCLRENNDVDLCGVRQIPSFEEVRSDPVKFNVATRMIHEETNPYNAHAIVQYHGKRALVSLPPPFPLKDSELDAIFELPYTRKPHPYYTRPIPAYEMIKHSITIMRGCFGGCSFCSIALHQGRIVQSRSVESVLSEIERIVNSSSFKGTITDIGGPTANMYKLGCRSTKILANCRRLSCIYPSFCKNLFTDHGPLLNLMREARNCPGIKHVFISSGIRMDLALLHPEYIKELSCHHVSGHLKVAPEHVSDSVLQIMRKPGKDNFQRFHRLFNYYSKLSGKEQYIVPYIISSHPGAHIDDELELALYLKKNNMRPRQIQDFLPSPMDISTSIYFTGSDPFTGEKVYVTKKESEKKVHRAVLQYFKKENRPIVHRILKALHKERELKLLFGTKIQ